MATAETIYYDKGTVKITNTRVILGQKNYALVEITSARLGIQRASRSIAYVLIIGGILVGIVAFVATGLSQWIGFAIAAACLLFAVPAFRAGKTNYQVELGGAGSNWPAYTSADRAEVQSIIDAVIAARSGLPQTPAVAPGLKRCPFCAEEIQAAAVVCKHCGRNVDPAVIKAEKQTASLNEIGKVGGAMTQVGCTLLVLGLGIVAAFLLWPVVSPLFLTR